MKKVVVCVFGFFKKNNHEKRPNGQKSKGAGFVTTQVLQNAVAAFGSEDVDLHNELRQIAAGSSITAQQLYWFIPTALFHILFPEVQTIDGCYVIMYPDESKKVFQFATDPVYNAIYAYLKSVCASLDKQTVYRILGHSSEFDVVNQALNARDEAQLDPKLEDLLLSGPVYIMTD